MSLTFVKQATPFDAPKIYNVIVSAYTEVEALLHPKGGFAALRENSFDILRDMSKMTVLVCTKNGNVIATVRFRTLQSGDATLAYISRLCVLPSEQRSGAGTQLLEEVERLCRARNVDTLALHSAAKLEKLVRFYYKNGFYIHSTTKSRGYTRGLFIKELTGKECDFTPIENL